MFLEGLNGIKAGERRNDQRGWTSVAVRAVFVSDRGKFRINWKVDCKMYRVKGYEEKTKEQEQRTDDGER
jgi:hypothetical protein